MIYLITNPNYHRHYQRIFDLEKELEAANEILNFEYTLDDGLSILKWLRHTKDTYIQLDTETNIVNGVYGWKGYLKGKNKDYTFLYDNKGKKIPERRTVYYVQIGSYDGKNQWVFDVLRLNTYQKEILKLVLNSPFYKLIHNALFDYTVIKANFGVDIKNIRCTFLASQILTTGFTVGEELPKGYHSLNGCVERILNVSLDKSEQTTFSDMPINLRQLKYGCLDISLLSPVFEFFIGELKKWELMNTFTLECSVTRSYGDSMVENLYLDPDDWQININDQEEKIKATQKEFYTILIDSFQDALPDFINKEEKYEFKWSSKNFKRDLINSLYNLDLNLSKKEDYKNLYLSLSDSKKYDLKPLELLYNNNFEDLEKWLIINKNDFLIDREIYKPANFVNLNLNSPEQMLKVFSLIKPDIKAVNKDELKKIKHPLVNKYREYKAAKKMQSSYGTNFLEQIDPDGMFRVKDYTQILTTGRSSMSMLQLLPGNDKYRNPFKPNCPKTGIRADGYKWVIVGADYASQELCVLATLSGEPSMLQALENGYDLHSINTASLFPEKWAELGGPKEPRDKPEDKTLQTLRNNTKQTIFGCEKTLN